VVDVNVLVIGESLLASCLPTLRLRAEGADVGEETQDMEGVGRFGWVSDPEGDRVELWQSS
jgi:predicted enzyme related to lactoylglutathione lyase